MSDNATASAFASKSTNAHGTIRGFSAIVTAVGIVAIILLSLPTVIPLLGGDLEGLRGHDTSQQHFNPWENPAPTAATLDGDTWSGQGQQYIPLTGLTPGQPLLLTFGEGSTYISEVFLSENLQVPADADLPSFTGYGAETAYLIPRGTEATMWLRVRDPEPWTARIVPVDLEDRSGLVSGKGPTAFVYTGDATAARVTARGDYGITISTVTEQGFEPFVDRFSDSTGTIAWADSETTTFVVESYSDAATWSIEFFERPAPAAPTPDPTEDSDE